jgi:hypothetical protein
MNNHNTYSLLIPRTSVINSSIKQAVDQQTQTDVVDEPLYIDYTVRKRINVIP